jgi:thiamine-phosphate pyrophosphorylase
VGSSPGAGDGRLRRVLRTDRLHSLAGARLYLCTDSRRRQGDLEEFLDEVLRAGVDIVQLREKGLEAAEELELLAIVTAAARRHGRLVAVNDRADLAALARSDIYHGGQRDLTPAATRSLLGPDVLIGRSTHSAAQFDEAVADPEVDYACAGPTWATPTKPGRPAAGLDLVRHAAASATDLPWFAIGGIDLHTLEAAVQAGARRAVVVRAITEADDPAAATTALLQRLPPLDPSTHSPSGRDGAGWQ